MMDTHVKGFVRTLLAAWILLFAASAHAQAVSPRLKERLSSSSVKVRVAAIVAIAKLKKAPDARPLLEGMLADPEPAVRAAAVEGLGRIGDPEALPAIRPLAADPAPPVAAIANRTVALLEARQAEEEQKILLGAVVVDIGDVADLSGRGVPDLDRALQKAVGDALEREGGRRYNVMRGGAKKGWGLGLKIRRISTSKQGTTSIVEVKCDMTVVELPGKVLRLASSATAAAGIEGALSEKLEAELAFDGVQACGPSLAKDYLEYMKTRK